MSKLLDTNLRQEIISQCSWSETYSSLKYILKRTAYQLPLLISFLNNNDDDERTTNKNYQTIFFFDRYSTNKILLTPLQQCEDQPDQFEVYPKHCTFVVADSFKGLFEFVRNGQRCSQIHTNLEQLINSTTNINCSIVFMSRDRTLGFFQDTKSSKWSNKEYPQGAIFRGERIHRSSVSNNNNQQTSNDYLECRDEDGFIVFIKMDQIGRFSLIATSIEQQEYQPEIYLHSTQTPNIDQLIKRLIPDNNNKNNTNCIRLVRGPVPHHFYCQYFRFVRQHTYDILVGLTQEGLVIEWNLESHVPCRYATNLNDILDNIYGTMIDRTLQSYIEQARIHHRDNFQHSMQLISSQDWTAFFQYWKWTGDIDQNSNEEDKIPYQSRHRFHLVASLQDLADHSQSLVLAFKKTRNPSPVSFTSQENKPIQDKKKFSAKQRSFLSQMSKLISSPTNSRKHHSERSIQQTRRSSALVLPNGTKPFDNSIYDSNQFFQPSKQNDLTNRTTQKIKRT